MSIVRKAVALAFACLVLALADPAARAAGAADANEHVETRLVAAVTGVGERESVPLGLYFRLAPGWKIYWRSPGDAGFPPRVDWTGSKNLENVETEWPAPKRFSIFGLETLGYTDEVVLPLTATLTRPGRARSAVHRHSAAAGAGPGPGWGFRNSRSSGADSRVTHIIRVKSLR